MDSQKIYDAFIQCLNETEASRCHRLSPHFARPEIALDDVQSFSKMVEMTTQQLQPDSPMYEAVLKLCRALLCTSFYLELWREPVYDDSLGLWHCECSILLRWQDDEMICQRFQQRLTGSSYYINGAPYKFSLPFETSFKVTSLQDMLNVSLKTDALGGIFGTSSGLPTPLAAFWKKQGRPPRSSQPCFRKRRLSAEEFGRQAKAQKHQTQRFSVGALSISGPALIRTSYNALPPVGSRLESDMPSSKNKGRTRNTKTGQFESPAKSRSKVPSVDPVPSSSQRPELDGGKASRLASASPAKSRKDKESGKSSLSASQSVGKSREDPSTIEANDSDRLSISPSKSKSRSPGNGKDRSGRESKKSRRKVSMNEASESTDDTEPEFFARRKGYKRKQSEHISSESDTGLEQRERREEPEPVGTGYKAKKKSKESTITTV